MAYNSIKNYYTMDYLRDLKYVTVWSISNVRESGFNFNFLMPFPIRYLLLDLKVLINFVEVEQKNPCWKVKWQLLQTSLNRLNYKRITKYYPNFHCLSLAATCFFLCFDEYFDKKFEFSAKTLPGLFTKQRWLCRFWKKND